MVAVLLVGACGGDSIEEPNASTGDGTAADGPGSTGGSSGPAPTSDESDESDGGSTAGADSTGADSTTGEDAEHCEAARAAAQSAAEAYVGDQNLVGLSVAVATDGCAPWSQAFGVASVVDDSPLTPEHIMRAGSVTKSYTAGLVLRLAEDGLLSLDDTLMDHAIDIPSADAITLRQLLNHTSGVADYQSNPAFFDALMDDPAREWEPQELIDFTVELGPVGAPGEAHAYSNANFVLAAMVVEAVTGGRYTDALHEYVLTPLDLQHTWVEGAESWDDPTATGHSVIDGAPPVDTTGQYHGTQVWSAGAVVATAQDVRLWIAALLGDEFLSESSRAELGMFVPAGPVSYSLGIFSVNAGDVAAFGHNGAVMGFQAAAFVEPSTATSVKSATTSCSPTTSTAIAEPGVTTDERTVGAPGEATPTHAAPSSVAIAKPEGCAVTSSTGSTSSVPLNDVPS